MSQGCNCFYDLPQVRSVGSLGIIVSAERQGKHIPKQQEACTEHYHH